VVYFRVVHATRHGHKGAPLPAYREQTVEIALGPKGAFENGNIGSLTCRISTEGVVTTLPPLRRNPTPPR